MRGDVFHGLVLLEKRSDKLTVKFQHGINHVRSDGHIVRFPAEEFTIKLLSAWPVGGGQLGPAKSAGRELELCLRSCFAHLVFLLYRMKRLSADYYPPAVKALPAASHPWIELIIALEGG